MTDSNDKKDDPFNPAALRLDQSYADTVGVKKLLTTVPVRKPNRQDFVRVHPDPAYRLTPAAIIEVKEDREVYLVHAGHGASAPRRILAGDAVSHDQSPGCCPPMAREDARSRREAERMAPFCGGGGRTGHEEVGAGYFQHVARRL